MRKFIVIFLISYLFSCNSNEEKTAQKENRLELVPEPDKELRLEYEKQIAEKKEITKSVNNFYSWYIKSTKNYDDIFQPKFGQDSNGNATLFFDKYIENLENHNFSDSLIRREIDSYQTCLSNLNNTSYSDFVNWDGLTEYEQTECDFGNQYRFTGGQEPLDTIKIIKFIKKDESNYEAKLSRGFYINSEKEISYSNDISMFLIKNNGEWKINSIEVL